MSKHHQETMRNPHLPNNNSSILPSVITELNAHKLHLNLHTPNKMHKEDISVATRENVA